MVTSPYFSSQVLADKKKPKEEPTPPADHVKKLVRVCDDSGMFHSHSILACKLLQGINFWLFPGFLGLSMVSQFNCHLTSDNQLEVSTPL